MPAAAVPGARVQDVSVTEERMPRSHMLLTVTISPRLCSAQFSKEMAYFQKNTQVPGFRKGGKKGNKVRREWRRNIHGIVMNHHPPQIMNT